MIIGHLSDFHFTTFFSKNNLDQIKFALDNLLSFGANHIVVTGDLSDNADPEDLEIIRGIFNELGLLNGERLSLVIGNHDIFGGIQIPEDIFRFPESCRNISYEEKVNTFYDIYSEAFSNCIYISSSVFPYAKLINGILLVGINSIARYSNLNNPFASNGSIDDPQYNELFKIFNQFAKASDKSVVMIHHHFNKIKVDKQKSGSLWQNIEKQTMKLRGKKRLYQLFKSFHVDLILHGHYHENLMYNKKGLRFSNSGGSFKNNSQNIYTNLINMESDPPSIDIKSFPKTIPASFVNAKT